MDRTPDNADMPRRLSPEMASFRLLVLAFIREYLGRFGVGPSQGEIVAAMASNRSRVREALRSLTNSGLIIRAKGERGITLPTLQDEAIRQLRAQGWRVNEDMREVHAPGCPISALPGGVELDYP